MRHAANMREPSPGEPSPGDRDAFNKTHRGRIREKRRTHNREAPHTARYSQGLAPTPPGAPGARRGPGAPWAPLSSARFPFGRPVSARLVGSNLATSRIHLARQTAKACRKSSDPLRRPVHQNA